MAEIITRYKIPHVPVPGLVFHYSYLWHDEYLAKRLDGAKDRPCVIVVDYHRVIGLGDRHAVDVAPITHRVREEDGVEIPLAVKKRMGLDDEFSWIDTTEVNRFFWPGPDLRPVPRSASRETLEWHYGVLAYDIFQKAKAAILQRRDEKRLAMVPRAGF